VTIAPAQPHGTIRTTLNAPSLSLRRHNAAAAATTTAAPAATEHSNRTFTDAELAQAWTQYIENHATDRLLINTMRVSHPQRTGAENVFEMVVESEIQVELINEALPDLLASLRGTLQNDLIQIHVRANNGASSPMTWNEREVLADMIKRHPAIKSFVDDLGLSLL
jgi:DNA-binding TFAR19-related protein (PDSD5 family)